MLDRREVGGRVIGAQAAFVVAEDHVHDPVQAVFDAPMIADDGAEAFGRQIERGDVEARISLALAVELAQAVQDDDAGEARPGVALAQPVNVVDHGGGARLEAAVLAVDGLIAADRRVLEAVGPLLGDEEIDVAAQGALVALQGEHVVGALVADLCGDGALASHGRRW